MQYYSMHLTYLPYLCWIIYFFIFVGPVASVEVMRDRVTGDPRGFAFVVFTEQSTVDLVMDEAKHEINHKIVDVKRAQARGIAPPSIHDGSKPPGNNPERTSTGNSSSYHGSAPHSNNNNNNNNINDEMDDNNNNELTPEQMHTKVFVGGLPAHVDRDELKKIFEQFGPVVDSIVMIDQVTNRSRCFGFVTFESGSNGAQRAIEVQPLQIGQRAVEVKLATPKAEQKRMPPTSAGPKHVGLRAGMSSSTASTGEYAGLAVAYGRSGWKAGYGSKAFGAAGWAIEGWADGGPAPKRDGFSFELLLQSSNKENNNNAKVDDSSLYNSNRTNNSAIPPQDYDRREQHRGEHHQRDQFQQPQQQSQPQPQPHRDQYPHRDNRDQQYPRHDSNPQRRHRDQHHHNEGPPIKRSRR
jgi:RNA-binding protein Musashi